MHIGEAIRKELERQEKTVVWLAEQIPCHRTNVYRIFEKDSIDTRILMRISNILDHDFFIDHSIELKEKNSGSAKKDATDEVKEPETHP